MSTYKDTVIGKLSELLSSNAITQREFDVARSIVEEDQEGEFVEESGMSASEAADAALSTAGARLL